jgi:hypothetical protein
MKFFTQSTLDVASFSQSPSSVSTSIFFSRSRSTITLGRERVAARHHAVNRW